MLSYVQAIVLGLLQGASELFPVSSLGHTVIFPALFGWHRLVAAQSATHDSFFLAFVVALHVGTALALVVYFRREWGRLVVAFSRTLVTRRLDTADERLSWLLVVATIPAGLTGLALEHVLRTLFARPLAAAVMLVANGCILAAGDRARRRQRGRPPVLASGPVPAVRRRPGSRRLDTLEMREAGAIGLAQVLALLAGISRSGVTMVAGLLRGLDHEDAARFSFLLATPIILAAGLLKLPVLAGPVGRGVRGQALLGGLAAAAAALVSVRFLMRYFRTQRLWPFAVYSMAFGTAMVLRFSL